MHFLIYGIAYACPHGKRNNVCPFHLVDHISYKEKVKWINSLNKNKKCLIVAYHMDCSEKRVKAAIKKIDKKSLP